MVRKGIWLDEDYVKRQARKVMRELGLGITNTDIRKIDVGEIK